MYEKAMQSCLEKRTNKLNELEQDYKKLEQDKIIVTFEEDMYYNLKIGRRYTNEFEIKHQKINEKEKEVNEKIENLKNEINMIKIEIEYIEKRIQKQA